MRGGAGGEGYDIHLKLTFPGMSPAARPVASDPQPSKTNYWLGNIVAGRRANVPTYGSLRWEGVYSSIRSSNPR